MIYRTMPLLGTAAILLTACVTTRVSEPDWKYERNALHIHVRADPELNLHEDAPHTLVLCIYQLGDPNRFNQLTEDADGISKLLECGLFDGSVATHRRVIVQPGEVQELELDRAAGARYVGVAAGYYALQKERVIRLYDIPLVLERRGLLRRTEIPLVGPLSIELNLGPSQIERPPTTRE